MRALSKLGASARQAYIQLEMEEKDISLAQFRSVGYQQTPKILWQSAPRSHGRAYGYIRVDDFHVLTRLGAEAKQLGFTRNILATKLLRAVASSPVLIRNLLSEL